MAAERTAELRVASSHALYEELYSKLQEIRARGTQRENKVPLLGTLLMCSVRAQPSDRTFL